MVNQKSQAKIAIPLDHRQPAGVTEFFGKAPFSASH